MYSVEDKKSAIRDVQRFLFVIGQNGDIPHLSIDGFYSEETSAAVRAFQRINLLEVTGTVDRETFDAIYVEYLKAQNFARASTTEFSSSSYPLKIGDSGTGVSYLNSLIRELGRFYEDLPIPYGDFYSGVTMKAVKLLQSYFRLEEDGEVSAELLNLIKDKSLAIKFQNT